LKSDLFIGEAHKLIAKNLSYVKSVFSHLPAYLVIGILTSGVNIIIFYLGIKGFGSIYVATLVGNIASIL
jgi:putative flippase GtrA